MSDAVWGIIMMAIGFFFAICGWKESQFSIYRLFVARSKILWGDKAHRFLLVSGIFIIFVGGVLALGLF